MNITIRKVRQDDIVALKEVLDTIELFPSEMLNDMIADYWNNPDSKSHWFTAVKNDKPVSLGYCAPEMMAQGTYNLYAIGVKAELQGKGIGKQMMGYIESKLKEQGQRILIVETSGTADFAATRQFYINIGYNQEAVIRDFWEEGDDKVIFWKKLN